MRFFLKKPSDFTEIVTGSVDTRRTIGDARLAVQTDQTGSAADAGRPADGHRIQHDGVGRAGPAGAARFFRVVTGRAGDAAGSVGALGARQTDGSAAFGRIGHVDAVDPGAVRVEQPQTLDTGHGNAAAGIHSVLTGRPALFLEGPVEGVGAVLRHGVGEMLFGRPSAPRLDDGNPFGRRTLHENELTIAVAIQLECEGNGGASGAESPVDFERQDQIGVGGVAVARPQMVAGCQPSGGAAATRSGVALQAHAARGHGSRKRSAPPDELESGVGSGGRRAGTARPDAVRNASGRTETASARRVVHLHARIARRALPAFGAGRQFSRRRQIVSANPRLHPFPKIKSKIDKENGGELEFLPLVRH